jgi:hypothetical protein
MPFGYASARATSFLGEGKSRARAREEQGQIWTTEIETIASIEVFLEKKIGANEVVRDGVKLTCTYH